jgi:hypothetical protein
MRLPIALAVLAWLVSPWVHAQTLTLTGQPGQTLSLAPDDFRLELQKQQAWDFKAPAEVSRRQVLLSFRVRIDNPSTIG